jgi:hypothetical protein
MNLLKESPLLGIQAIPPFVKEATLFQNVQCWADFSELENFPAANSIYNIAALAFYPRLRMVAVGGRAAQALSITYWASSNTANIANIYGVSKVLVPQGAEYFAVAWIQPPDWTLEIGPFPEEMFRVVWGLGL